MRTASLERTFRAFRGSWQAITSCDIQHRPVQGNRIAPSQHSVCHSMQCRVVADIGLFREYDEVATEQSCHTGIHQRMRLAVDKQQCGVGYVLSDGGDLFEFLPPLGPCNPSADQFLCQSLQRWGAATPKTNWLQVSRKLRKAGFRQGSPSRVFLQESWQESLNRFCARPLQKNFYDQPNVWGGRCLSPKKPTPFRCEPEEKFLAESGDPVIANRFSWSAIHFHGKIARCSARYLLTHQIYRVIH